MFGYPKTQKDLVEHDTGINISWKHRFLKKEKKKEKRRFEMEQHAAKRRMIQDAVGYKRS